MAFETLGGFLRKVASAGQGVGAVVVTTDSTDPLLVESTSVSKGDARGTSTTTATLLSSLVTIPTGATKVLITPDAQVSVSDKNTPSATVGYRVPATVEWRYDGDSIATLKLYGAANFDAWFYA